MVKPKAKDIKKEIEKQNEEVYGDTSISGSMPDPSSDDDVEEVLKETMGKDASEDARKHDTQTIAEEVDGDEKARHTKPDIDFDED